MSPGLSYGLMWAGFGVYLAVLASAPRLGGRLVWGAIVALLAGFALAPVLLSQDVYSYVDYARLGVLHELNPYLHPPAAVPFDPAYAEVGWTEATSAYGPLFTLATYPLAWLPVGIAVAMLKAAAALSVLGLAILLARLARPRGVDPLRAAAFVALNPLVLVHVVGGAHNDGTTMLLAVVGCAAVLGLRAGGGGFAIAAATGLKLSAAFVVPFALLGTRSTGLEPFHIGGFRPVDWSVQFVLGAGIAIAATLVAGWLAFGPHFLDSATLAGENQGRVSNYSIPNLLSELLNVDVDLVRTLTAIGFLAVAMALLVWVWRGADWIRATGWTALTLLLATAWLLPWYIVWALPFAAISRDERLVAAVLLLTAVQLAARIPL